MLEFRGDVTKEAWRTHAMREMVRTNMPEGIQGFVAEDLDLIIRWFGPRYGLDDEGRTRAIELKAYESTSNMKSKRYAWRNMRFHERTDRFDGLFVVYHDDDNHDENTRYWLNSLSNPFIELDEFLAWLGSPFSQHPDYFSEVHP